MRCVFSSCLNDNPFASLAGAPPGTSYGGAARSLLQTPTRALRAIFDDLSTVFFPADCKICDAPLLRVSTVPVCDDCIGKIQPQQSSLCKICGEALDMESARYAGQYPAEGLLCAPCRLAAPPFERAIAYTIYQDETRELIHLLKYERMPAVAAPLGKLLAQSIESLVESLEASLEQNAQHELAVIAVPLHPARERQRGYNQSILIADAALRQLQRTKPNWKLTAAHHALRRVKNTESQYALSPKGRRRNLQGAFAVSDSTAIKGCAVLLVDDIYTTGATARACATALRHAGAEKVWVATVSRAQPEMVAAWDMKTWNMENTEHL